MLKFLKYVFATLTGIFLFFILSFIFILILVSIATPDREKQLAERPVLRITLNKTITERETDDFFAQFTSPFTSREGGTIGLIELRKSIKKAAKNNNIKGILLDIRRFNAGMAQIEELRDELILFKESGKFLYAYSDNYTQKGYYLASIADKIFLPPNGDLDFSGFDSEVVFFTGMLEKLNLKPEIFRVGEFKSAVETFTNRQMSEESRRQTQELLNSVFADFLHKVSEARGIEEQMLRNIADSLLIRKPEDAKQYQLITHMAYFDSLETIIRQDADLDKEKKIEYSRYTDLYDLFERNGNKRKVAVVVMEGNIEQGAGRRNVIGSESFTEEIRKARLDDDVKAVVVRINSPGGSALASDLIWREIEITNRVKPVIASMSDVAASGGYYIAVACDTIVAHPSTITGSIGVFGLLINAKEFLNDKLGITTDRVKTSPFSDIGSFTREMTPKERQIIQESVERIYEDFLNVVAKGREMQRNDVHEIAQGRVWSGTDAKKINLTDVNGGLEDAIRLAAQKADLGDDFSVSYLPEIRDPFLGQLIRTFFDDREEEAYEEHLGQLAPYVKALKEAKKMEGVQARMPFVFYFE